MNNNINKYIFSYVYIFSHFTIYKMRKKGKRKKEKGKRKKEKGKKV